MMSLNQWITLWLTFVCYLLLGASVFYAIERKNEEVRRVEENIENLQLREILVKYYSNTSPRVYHRLVVRLREYCNFSRERQNEILPFYLRHTDSDQSEEEQQRVHEVQIDEEYQWTFYNSFFFALTTLSTIGYGNLHPTSSVGRILVIFYSLVGIPLNGIVLTQLGECFASTFFRVHQRYKGSRRFETRFVLVVDIITYLVPGVLVFIFLPSGLFVYFEGWTFDESIYFAFVTLTTIGYGDYVAGQKASDKKWYLLYKIVLVLWIMFGLGYLVMILGFISRAMRCKRMARLEQKLAQNLRHTHSKLWNGFAKDVTHLRRLLNEVYLLKFKPVYRDKSIVCFRGTRARSYSAPNLTEWPTLHSTDGKQPVLFKNRTQRTEEEEATEEGSEEEELQLQFEKYKMHRRKALSENVLRRNDLKVRSESDLSQIDKVATFGTASHIEPNQLLARVVDVLGTTYGIDSQAPSEDGDGGKQEGTEEEKEGLHMKEFPLSGVDGFSSEEILSSERWKPDLFRRSCSIPLEEDRKTVTYSEQWTWPASSCTTKSVEIDGSRHELKSTSITGTARKRSSLQLPGVNRIRRMSNAALNFLSSSARNLASKRESRDTNGEYAQKNEKKQASVTSKRDRKKQENKLKQFPRYSLCDADYETMCDYINYFTQTGNKRGDFIDLLQSQIGKSSGTHNISPVLEHTTIADFIRVLNSIQNVRETRDYNVSEVREHKFQKTPSLFSIFDKNSDVNLKHTPPKTSFTDLKYRYTRRYSSVYPDHREQIPFNRRRHYSNCGENPLSSSKAALPIPQIRKCLETEFGSGRSVSYSQQDASSSPMVTLNGQSSDQTPAHCGHRFSVKPATFRTHSRHSSVSQHNRGHDSNNVDLDSIV